MPLTKDSREFIECLRSNGAVARRSRERSPVKKQAKRSKRQDDELRPEYDLTTLLKSGIRGKHAREYVPPIRTPKQSRPSR